MAMLNSIVVYEDATHIGFQFGVGLVIDEGEDTCQVLFIFAESEFTVSKKHLRRVILRDSMRAELVQKILKNRLLSVNYTCAKCMHMNSCEHAWGKVNTEGNCVAGRFSGTDFQEGLVRR